MFHRALCPARIAAGAMLMNTSGVPERKKGRNPLVDFGPCWTAWYYKLVEAAGVEPASEERGSGPLHA